MVRRIVMFSSSRRETILCMLSKNSSALIVLKEAGKRGIFCPFNLFSSSYPGGAFGCGGTESPSRIFRTIHLPKTSELALGLFQTRHVAENKVRGVKICP